MTDHAPDGESNAGPESESPPPAPRWVKAFAIIAVVLLALFVLRHLAGGGFRGHSLP